jgi:hypothetical protein
MTDDWIGEFLPHDSQEAPGDPVTLSLESDGPPELDHCVSATPEPGGKSHVVKFDCHHGFARELKVYGSVPLKGRGFG